MRIEQIYNIFQQYPVISADSRNCPPNALFFALRGNKFDGNDYIGQVLDAGAAYAIGDKKNLPENGRIIRVDNVLQTLQDLANYHRKQMNVTLIAITGTNGKTTTKELIAAALSSRYKTLYTQGNLNNHIGVPLTLLQLKPEHDYAVIEMGANHPGEIHTLCRIAEPNYGLITNIGKAHLEGFGSFEGVIRAKAELYDFLREKGGTIFGNLDNLILKNLYISLPTIYYGTSPKASVYGRITATEPNLALEWNGGAIATGLVGNYNFENVLAAICIANYFGVEPDRINESIRNYIPANNRSQNMNTGKNQLIVDAYNANPSSMQAALDNFNSLKISPKMAILGEMKELGDYSREEHQRLVDQLSSQLDAVFLVGENFTQCSSCHPEWKLFPSTEALIEHLQALPVRAYHILIKGSRGNQLEKIIPYL